MSCEGTRRLDDACCHCKVKLSALKEEASGYSYKVLDLLEVSHSHINIYVKMLLNTQNFLLHCH